MPATKESAQQLESSYGEPVKPTFGKRLAANLRKWWWVYLLVLIVLVLVIVLPIIYVGYPKIAQNGINSSRLEVISQNISNPSSDALDLTLNSVLLTSSSYHPNLDTFNGSLYLSGASVPFAAVEVPGFKAENGTVNTITQYVQITNITAFTQYTTTTLESRNLTVYLRGTGGLKLSSLPKTTVHYDQQIDLKGLKNFDGMNITQFSLVLNNTLPYSANGVGRIMIPNPTVSTIEFGNVTLNMDVGGSPIGNITLPNFTLQPGNMTYDLYSTSNQTAVLELLKQPAYCSGLLPLRLHGTQSSYNGQDLPYFSQALQSSVQHVSLDLKGPLQAIGLGSILNSTCSA